MFPLLRKKKEPLAPRVGKKSSEKRSVSRSQVKLSSAAHVKTLKFKIKRVIVQQNKITLPFYRIFLWLVRAFIVIYSFFSWAHRVHLCRFIFFSSVSSSRTHILAPLSWPPFWKISTLRGQIGHVISAVGLLSYIRHGRGCGITFAAGSRSLNRFQIIIIGHDDPLSWLSLSCGKIGNCEQSIQLRPFPFFIKWLKIINMFIVIETFSYVIVDDLACVQTSPLPQKKSGEETSVNRRR